MANYTLQLKRNQTGYQSKSAALTGLKGALAASTAIGEPMIAIYIEDGVEKVLFGIVSSTGKYTIFEGATLDSTGNIEVPEVVQDAIDDAISGVQGDTESTIKDVEDAIAAMNFTGATGGSVITQVIQTDGVVSATAANLTSGDKTVTVNGLDLAVNIDGTTIVKDSSTGKISVASKALTMEGKDAIEVEDGESGKTIKLNIASGDKVLSQSEDGLLASLELKYTKKTDTANGKIELIGKDNTVISTFDTADFTVDGFLDSVAWKGDGSNILVFTWNTDAGKTTTDIDLTKYIDTYLAGNGLNLDSATKTFSVKVKDSDKYLTVDGDGVASKGIDESIAAAVNALDAEVTSTDGDFVTVKVTEVDGKVTAVSVSEEDIASETALNAEIAARKAVTGVNADTYTANTSTNYLKSVGSLKSADEALDAALKVEADKIVVLQGQMGEKSVENQITDAIEGLNNTDTAEEGQYVTKVDTVDGIATSSRRALLSSDANNALSLGATDKGLFLSTTLDCGRY